jgi:hypothetical protein
MPERSAWFGLFRRRQCPVPTLRGWALLLLGAVAVAALAVREVYPFLAVNDPQPGGVLVIDGAEDDPALKGAIAEFHRHHYDKLCVTGGPLLTGTLLSKYSNYAAQGASRLLQLGLGADAVQAVPATRARSDPAYQEAVCLGDWFRQHEIRPHTVNLLVEGPSARRTRLMFEKALGKGVRVGVVALRPRNYDPDRWWRSSEGVRVVIGEVLGYGYARCFFRKAGS